MKILFLLFLFLSTLLSSEIYYLEDATSSLNEKSVLQRDDFLPLDKSSSNFAMTDSTFWLKLSLKNSTEKEQEKVINFAYPLLDQVQLYALENGVLEERAKAGNLIKQVKRERVDPNLTFRILLEADTQHTYYLKVNSVAPMTLDMNIYTSAEFENHKLLWASSIVFYVAAAMTIIIYNLILFLLIRVRAYLYYVLGHISFLFLVLNIGGFTVQFIYPQNPLLGQFYIPFSIASSAFFQALFAYEFLEVKKYGKKSNHLMRGLLAISIFILFTNVFLSYKASTQIANLSSLLSTVITLFVTLYYVIRFQSQSAKYYTAAWTLFIIGIMVEHLKNLGFIEVNIFTLNAMQIGAIVEMLIISIALANRFSNLKDKNLQLNNMVTTDVLTSIKNRRYFFEHTKALLASLKRKNEEHALIMMDIDYFKKINDTYGHASGDKVLKAFTENISKYLREEDSFARIGGEEFVLTIRASRDAALILTQRLKEATQNLVIDCEKGDLNFTISMGVCLFKSAALETDELLKRADEALYTAKANGRNRVEVYGD